MRIKFILLGEPKGKGRPRFSKKGFTYTPKETVLYENYVRCEYQRQCGDIKFPRETYLDMRIMAFYAIPKSINKKKQTLMRQNQIRPAKKPDMDNVIKVIADSLNDIAYADDVQIVDSMVRKFYSDTPRVEVLIQEVQGVVIN